MWRTTISKAKNSDADGLDGYAVNPEHVPVAQFGSGLCEQIVAVDFE